MSEKDDNIWQPHRQIAFWILFWNCLCYHIVTLKIDVGFEEKLTCIKITKEMPHEGVWRGPCVCPRGLASICCFGGAEHAVRSPTLRASNLRSPCGGSGCSPRRIWLIRLPEMPDRNMKFNKLHLYVCYSSHCISYKYFYNSLIHFNSLWNGKKIVNYLVSSVQFMIGWKYRGSRVTQ